MSNPTDDAEIDDADDSSTVSTTSTSTQTPIGVHISTALLEIGFLVSEFMIGQQVVNHLKSFVILPSHTNYFHILEVFLNVLGNILLIQFIIFTVAFNLGISSRTVIIRMGLDKPLNISKMVIVILILHIFGVGVNYVLFTMYDKWLFTLDNILDPFTGTWHYSRIISLCIISPITEEIVHRGLVFLLLYRHVNPMNYSGQIRNSNYNKSNLVAIKRCMIISGVVFGLIHGLNLFGSVYSKEYTIMQIIVGCIISFFYTLRMVITCTLWECILLHIINNSFSMFISFGGDDVTNPLIVIPS